jgi:hypothetical protein
MTPMNDISHIFTFDSLRKGELGITLAYGSFLAEAASYCLKFKQHVSPVLLHVSGDLPTSGNLQWNDGGENLDTTYADLQEATEYGAYGVALVVAVKLTGITCVERSAKGTGIDYWLCRGVDGRGLLQRAARLEVSGILEGDESAISARLNRKLVQTEQSDKTSLPAYVAIIEFGLPNMRLVERASKKK